MFGCSENEWGAEAILTWLVRHGNDSWDAGFTLDEIEENLHEVPNIPRECWEKALSHNHSIGECNSIKQHLVRVGEDKWLVGIGFIRRATRQPVEGATT